MYAQKNVPGTGEQIAVRGPPVLPRFGKLSEHNRHPEWGKLSVTVQFVLARKLPSALIVQVPLYLLTS
jgi:hypothetical protein